MTVVLNEAAAESEKSPTGTLQSHRGEPAAEATKRLNLRSNRLWKECHQPPQFSARLTLQPKSISPVFNRDRPVYLKCDRVDTSARMIPTVNTRKAKFEIKANSLCYQPKRAVVGV